MHAWPRTVPWYDWDGRVRAAGAPAAAKEAVKEDEPEEDVDMGGLFGDDY